jgi:two-component system response regulator HydG
MSTRSYILVADDEADSSRRLGAALEKDGHYVRAARDGEEACQVITEENVDLLISELVIPSLNGFELLDAAHQVRPTLPVILVSSYGTIETAVKALRQGAFHYFQKPLDLDAVRATVAEALGSSSTQTPISPASRGRQPAASRGRQPAAPGAYGLGIVGQGPWLQQALDLVRRVAPSRATVLLTGESGTGKELFARAIHSMKGRSGPFVAVSCGALSRDLLESELFGHEKGAFTGADRQKPGRFELADGGTLFLDEIAEMPVDLQVKLLRVLQERQFERVGGTDTLTVDVRIIAATNRDLATAVRERTFREDLYYRLKVVEIGLLPLRQRPEDIEPLATHFVQIYARANGKRIARVSPEALELLRRYPWPGNARELENYVERAVVLAEPEATEIDPSLLPDAVRLGSPELRFQPVTAWGPSVSLRRGGEQLQRAALGEALMKTNGNATLAAQLLGVSPRWVRYHADRWDLWRRGTTSRARKP